MNSEQTLENTKSLPFTMYEYVAEASKGVVNASFEKTVFKLESGEAEGIAVNHVAKESVADTSEGAASRRVVVELHLLTFQPLRTQTY